MRKSIVATAGAAAAAAAATAVVRLRRSQDDGPVAHDGRPRIVVVGGGFAGVNAIETLGAEIEPGDANITLVDRNNYHLFTPLLYQVATGSVDSPNIAYPLRPFCHRNGVALVTANVRNVNLIDRVVETDEGNLSYDYLVLGLGSQTNYFGMAEVERRSLGLKALPSANEIRHQIIASVEDAAVTSDPAARQRLLTFVIVGAGATGVELVGSLHDLIHNNLIPYYDGLRHEEVRIILVEAMDSILPGTAEKAKAIALHRIEDLGIDLRLKTAVSGIEDGAVVTRTGERIPANTIIWTAGIRPNPVAASLALEKSRDGRIVVDEYLRIPNHPDVFVLGDNAFAHDTATKQPLPPNAAVAKREGEATGRNLARLVRGEPIEPFTYKSLGELIALGRGHATAEIGPVIFGGLPAWIVWRGFYLTRLMGMKNRAGVAVDWATTLLSRRYIADIEA